MADEKSSLLQTRPPPSNGSSSSSFHATYTDLNESPGVESQRPLRARAIKGMTLLDQWINTATYPWKWLVKTTCAKAYLAEFFGTFLLVVSI